MLVKFYPNAYISSLQEISPAYFKQRGIKGLILDLDNTIIPWKAGVLRQETVNLLKNYTSAGLKLCIVSNAFNRRVTNLLKPLGVPWVARAGKPRRKPFVKALKILGTGPHETAVIGDQLFTDILGGNRIGLYTMLVIPMSKREFVGTKLVRVVEKAFLRRLAKKGIIEIPR